MDRHGRFPGGLSEYDRDQSSGDQGFWQDDTSLEAGAPPAGAASPTDLTGAAKVSGGQTAGATTVSAPPSYTPLTSTFAASTPQIVALSSLFNLPTSGAQYLVLDITDRDEYTGGSKNDITPAGFGYLTSTTGATAQFSDAVSDFYTIGVVFTLQSNGEYYNSNFGYFNQVSFVTSSNPVDNVSLSLFTSSNSMLSTIYDTRPDVLLANSSYFTYQSSVGISTVAGYSGTPPAQATPDSVVAAALSFVGQDWNENGCWVLASTIANLAGAALPLISTFVDVAGQSNGEWLVAYDGPVSANSNWVSLLRPGDMVNFVTASGGGHITTVVSGTGSNAKLVDNAEFVSGSTVVNAANDGSSSDIVIQAPFSAMDEFTGVNASEVVIYALDTPIISETETSTSLSLGASLSLAPIFSATMPVAGQTVTQWQVYDNSSGGRLVVNGVAESITSAADAVTLTSLSGVSLGELAGGTDTLEIRAYDGAYWGDWVSLVVNTSGSAPAPALLVQTASQTWYQGLPVDSTLPSGTFGVASGQSLGYVATLSTGAGLPSWLTFNAARQTFTGTEPVGTASFAITVTATDTAGLSASETFAVATPADAPVVSQTVASASPQVGTALALSSIFSANLPIAGQTTSGWQVYDTSANGSFVVNGTAETALGAANAITVSSLLGVSLLESGSAADTVYVRAMGGTAPSDWSSLTVTPFAQAPVLATQAAAQSWYQGLAVSFALPSGSFSDPNGEALAYTATLPGGADLPPWLSFDATTQIFSGTEPVGTAAFSITITAADTSGLSAIETFAVATPADAAAVSQTESTASPQVGSTLALGPIFSATLPISGQTVSGWQFYDSSATGSFVVNGTVETALGAANAITVSSLSAVSVLESGTAPDTVYVQAIGGTTPSGWASLSVTPYALAPVLVTQAAPQAWYQGLVVSFALPAGSFSDLNGEALTYSASLSSGGVLPSWLSFNPTTQAFSGTEPLGTTAFSLAVTATDTSGLSASETVAVTTPADAPVVSQTETSASPQVGTALSLGTIFSATLPLSGQSVTSWQVYDTSANGRFLVNGIATGAQGLADAITVTSLAGLALEEVGSGSDTLYVQAVGGTAPSAWAVLANTPYAVAPVLAAQTATQTWAQGTSVSFILPSGTFSDPNGEALAYAASLAGGAALPSWLSFNPAPQTFSGIVPAKTAAFTLTVTATDSSGLSVKESFAVQTTNVVTAALAVADSQAGTVPPAMWVTDSTADIAASFDGLQAAVAADDVLGFTLTDNNPLQVTGAQYQDDAVLRAALPTTATYLVTAAMPAQLATLLPAAKVLGITVSVIAPNVAGDVTTLNAAAPKLSAVTVTGIPSAFQVNLTGLDIPTTVDLTAGNATMAINGGSIGFYGNPFVITPGIAATTIDGVVGAATGVQEILDFTPGLDRLDLALGGATLMATNATLNGQAAIVLTSTTDKAQGAILLGSGLTAASLMASHLTLSQGQAIIT